MRPGGDEEDGIFRLQSFAAAVLASIVLAGLLLTSSLLLVPTREVFKYVPPAGRVTRHGSLVRIPGDDQFLETLWKQAGDGEEVTPPRPASGEAGEMRQPSATRLRGHAHGPTAARAPPRPH